MKQLAVPVLCKSISRVFVNVEVPPFRLTIIHQDVVENRDGEWNQVLIFEAADDSRKQVLVNDPCPVLVRVCAGISHQTQSMDIERRSQPIDLEQFGEEFQKTRVSKR